MALEALAANHALSAYGRLDITETVDLQSLAVPKLPGSTDGQNLLNNQRARGVPMFRFGRVGFGDIVWLYANLISS
jgi:hypothetical protein